jgi:hypothetical protein
VPDDMGHGLHATAARRLGSPASTFPTLYRMSVALLLCLLEIGSRGVARQRTILHNAVPMHRVALLHAATNFVHVLHCITCLFAQRQTLQVTISL